MPNATPVPVRALLTVNFSCGCICEFPLLGSFERLEEGVDNWHIYPCRPCAEKREPEELEERAGRIWNKLMEELPRKIEEKVFKKLGVSQSAIAPS